MEYKTPTGATIKFNDDAYRNKTEKELKEREDYINTVASILAQKIRKNENKND
ncbi:hypothetical protein [Anaerovorax odorimutans]|uniref:hypothetical protein n=1 Tax=Anaerovorax odorimutans TaxID=109327 RepID=UPI0004016027|nr:hypothetical protein [Anaerovorax odorimutans]